MTNNTISRIETPICIQCGVPTRLIGIEPHPAMAHTDLRTFACTQCDALQTQSMPMSLVPMQSH
jgi:hypothetical protein